MSAVPADDLEARTLAATSIAKEAGTIARRYFRNAPALSIQEKGPGDVVTAADQAVDQFIRERLLHLFPGDHILSEESAGGGDGDLWVIDPIDGTSNFARGTAHFAISIAFVRTDAVEIGVIYDVMADELFVARKGQGATCNGIAIGTSLINHVMAPIIECGYSGRHPMSAYIDRVRVLSEHGFDFCQRGSAALGLAQVACGRLDGYWELHLFAWDVLAGLLLVREAGGWTSDFDPRADLGGAPVLACTAGIAADLRSLTEIGHTTDQADGQS